MKSLLCCLLSLFAISSPLLSRSGLTINEAINMAGRQRMLSQRIAKACVASYYLKMESETTQISSCSDLFSSSLEELKGYVANDEYKEQMAFVNKLWTSYQFIIEDDLSPENLVQIIDMSDKLLEACERVVTTLVLYAPSVVNEERKERTKDMSIVIDNAGHQRMYSQRMALYFLADIFNVGDSITNKERLSTTSKNFKDGLKQLMVFQKNTKEIDRKISETISLWKRVNDVNKSITTLNPSMITEITAFLKDIDILLVEMDMLTRMYENIADNGTPTENGTNNFLKLYQSMEEGN